MSPVIFLLKLEPFRSGRQVNFLRTRARRGMGTTVCNLLYKKPKRRKGMQGLSATRSAVLICYNPQYLKEWKRKEGSGEAGHVFVAC